MKAGRELDQKIAQVIFGWRCEWVRTQEPKATGRGMPPGVSHPNQAVEVPHYSTDIADAWEVVEKLMKGGSRFMIQNECLPNQDSYLVSFFEHVAKADTAAEAICLAALKAVEK